MKSRKLKPAACNLPDHNYDGNYDERPGQWRPRDIVAKLTRVPWRKPMDLLCHGLKTGAENPMRKFIGKSNEGTEKLAPKTPGPEI